MYQEKGPNSLLQVTYSENSIIRTGSIKRTVKKKIKGSLLNVQYDLKTDF